MMMMIIYLLRVVLEVEHSFISLNEEIGFKPKAGHRLKWLLKNYTAMHCEVRERRSSIESPWRHHVELHEDRNSDLGYNGVRRGRQMPLDEHRKEAEQNEEMIFTRSTKQAAETNIYKSQITFV